MDSAALTLEHLDKLLRGIALSRDYTFRLSAGAEEAEQAARARERAIVHGRAGVEELTASRANLAAVRTVEDQRMAGEVDPYAVAQLRAEPPGDHGAAQSWRTEKVS